MKLLNCILTAIIADLLGTWILILFLSSQSGSGSLFLYALVMIFGCMFVPVLLTVLLFVWLKKYIGAKNRLLKYLAQTGLVLLIMAIGTLLMTAMRSFDYWQDISAFSPGNLENKFNEDYNGFVPVVLMVSFLIPATYYWVSLMTRSEQK